MKNKNNNFHLLKMCQVTLEVKKKTNQTNKNLKAIKSGKLKWK